MLLLALAMIFATTHADEAKKPSCPLGKIPAGLDCECPYGARIVKDECLCSFNDIKPTFGGPWGCPVN